MKLRKIVSLILAAIMLMSCFTVVLAAGPAESVHVSARNDAPKITIDGIVSEKELPPQIATILQNHQETR